MGLRFSVLNSLDFMLCLKIKIILWSDLQNKKIIIDLNIYSIKHLICDNFQSQVDGQSQKLLWFLVLAVLKFWLLVKGSKADSQLLNYTCDINGNLAKVVNWNESTAVTVISDWVTKDFGQFKCRSVRLKVFCIKFGRFYALSLN